MMPGHAGQHQTKGRIDVTDFALSYDTIDGAVEAVTDADIHVQSGRVRLDRRPVRLRKVDAAERGRRASSSRRPAPSRVDGEPIDGPSADRGMVFQQYSLFPWKTVRENVEFGLKMTRHGPLQPRPRRANAARPRGTVSVRESLSRTSVRRHEAARRHRAGARHRSRRCCCSTSRSARSTRRRASSCSRSSPTCGSG